MRRVVWILIASALNLHAQMAPWMEPSHRAGSSWIERKNSHLVRQKHDYSCGSASLATLLRYYYHRHVSEKQILEAIKRAKGITDANLKAMIKEGKAGLSFLDLSNYAQTLGFRSIAMALDMEALSQLKLPVIIYLVSHDLGHFSVYKGMDAQYVYLADPSFGNTAMRRAKFEKLFYQRKDNEYPGKILAFLPESETVKPDELFMELPKHKHVVYDTIRSRLVR